MAKTPLSKHGPDLNRDWVGLRVATNRPVKNRLVEVPTASAGTVSAYSPGSSAITVRFDPCDHCGIAAVVSGLVRASLVILTPKEDWLDTKGGLPR